MLNAMSGEALFITVFYVFMFMFSLMVTLAASIAWSCAPIQFCLWSV